MRHDLAARHGWATDLTLGTDCAREITARGKGEVPDAARWLGLDRRAFVTTACVRQSDLRLATDEADGIRGYVERAAATTPGEETAAAALARLEAFQREHVGTDRSTTRPLQVAQRAVASASATVDDAVARQELVSSQSAQAHALRVEAEAQTVRLAQAEAAQAAREALRLAERARSARELAAPVAVPPLPDPTAARRPSVLLLLAAALSIVGGSALLAIGLTAAGVAALVAGVLLVAAFAWARRSMPSSSPVDMAAWLAARDAETARRARLEAVLEGTSVDDLVARAAAASSRADQLAAVAGSTVDVLDIDAIRREQRDAERRADLAEQEVAQLWREQTPVPEAESALALAQAELSRLESLNEVLTRTQEYLSRAQTRVYRDIAPRLAAAVGSDLATVTGGRYTEAFVDPHTLAVRVRGTGAALRDADHLSVGTAEQVYLLLRVALAEHLVTEGESCPLLLDDVTVHADEGRTARLLDVLLTIAARHQVILFTQQRQVLEWARDRLHEPRNAVHELTALAPV